MFKVPTVKNLQEIVLWEQLRVDSKKPECQSQRPFLQQEDRFAAQTGVSHLSARFQFLTAGKVKSTFLHSRVIQIYVMIYTDDTFWGNHYHYQGGVTIQKHNSTNNKHQMIDMAATEGSLVN